MRRGAFLTLAAAPLLYARARAQSDADPAISSRRQTLRVLLGRGEATAVSTDNFTFDGNPYRGTYLRQEDDRIVNVVALEEYLYSVVSREMPSGWAPQALQAQAICARTYVLQRSDPRRSYDVVPSELDQLYEGISGETPSGVAAVDATGGEVLSFGGEFAHVAYSSCCGGHTESSADAWGNVGVPYLAGVVCTSCVGSPNYRWNRDLGFDAIATPFSSTLASLGRLNDVRIAVRDASGRARALELVADGGSETVAGSLFRRSVGSRALPSLLLAHIERKADGSGVSIEGAGLGHGVGLCQWGARGMAQDNASAAEILAFYFPGTVVHELT